MQALSNTVTPEANLFCYTCPLKPLQQVLCKSVTEHFSMDNTELIIFRKLTLIFMVGCIISQEVYINTVLNVVFLHSFAYWAANNKYGS